MTEWLSTYFGEWLKRVTAVESHARAQIPELGRNTCCVWSRCAACPLHGLRGHTDGFWLSHTCKSKNCNELNRWPESALGSFYNVFIFGLVVYWCVRFLFSFPLLCASAFYSLRLPTEYERNGRYEGSRWGKWFLLKIFHRYLLHFCGRGNTFRTFCVISLLHVGLLRAGSSLWSGSVCAAGAQRPREGATVLPPPAHRPSPSGFMLVFGC